MRLFLAAIALATTASAADAGFRAYPGFLDPYAKVEMVHDRGLTMEIVVRCRRKANGAISPGILSYSKVERLFCSSKGRCTGSARRAAQDTCGS